jgi:hypothetical protein
VLCHLAATTFEVKVHLVGSTILFMASPLLLVSFSGLTGVNLLTINFVHIVPNDLALIVLV